MTYAHLSPPICLTNYNRLNNINKQAATYIELIRISGWNSNDSVAKTLRLENRLLIINGEEDRGLKVAEDCDYDGLRVVQSWVAIVIGLHNQLKHANTRRQERQEFV